jgi:hypothetical protein
MLQHEKIKNMSTLLYPFLAIQYCDLIEKIKIFIINMLCASKTHFSLYHPFL